MIRNLKVLGLALVAMFAMSAVVASAASASEVISEEEVPFTLTGTEDGQNALTGAAGDIECPGSTVTGHKTTKTSETGSHELIPSGASSVTVTPKYINCLTTTPDEAEHKTTVTMNGCDYDLTIDPTEPANTYPVTGELVCPENKDVVIDVYPFKGSELGGVACTVTIKAQGGLKGVHVINVPGSDPKDLTLTGTFTNIKSSQSGFGCESSESTTDELHVNYTVKADNAAGNQIDVTVVD